MGAAVADRTSVGTKWKRAHIAHGLARGADGKPRIDQEQGIIYGYAVATKGEALGHHLWLDDFFLDSLVMAGNTPKGGVKSRFDHPQACSSSMGTAIGRTKNFRKDGDIVRGDLFLLQSAKASPHGDLWTYTLQIAEQDPDLFGASIVFAGDSEEPGDESGLPEGLVLARLDRLYASDIVDDPAANPGGFFAIEDTMAARAEEFLSRFMPQLLDRYFQSRGTVTFTREGIMSDENAVKDAVKAALKAERERVKGIHDALLSVWGSDESKIPPRQATLCREMIEDGETVEEAQHTFKVHKKRVLDDNGSQSAGGGTDTTERHEDLSALPEEERWKREFEKDASLRAEFQGKLNRYVAFKNAEANGRVKIYTNQSEQDAAAARR